MTYFVKNKEILTLLENAKLNYIESLYQNIKNNLIKISNKKGNVDIVFAIDCNEFIVTPTTIKAALILMDKIEDSKYADDHTYDFHTEDFEFHFIKDPSGRVIVRRNNEEHYDRCNFKF